MGPWLAREKKTRQVLENAGQWFILFAELPYDATYDIERLLDCMQYLMTELKVDKAYYIDAL